MHIHREREKERERKRERERVYSVMMDMPVNHGPSQQSSKRRIQAMEMRCYRKILRISHKDLVINEEVRAKIQQAIGPH